jgi:hypothetical protein
MLHAARPVARRTAPRLYGAGLLIEIPIGIFVCARPLRRVVLPAHHALLGPMNDPFKRRRVDPAVALLPKALDTEAAPGTAATATRANVIAQLVSRDGTPTGPQLDLPVDVTPKQLEELLNGLLRAEEPTPYAFYASDAELTTDLGSHLTKAGASVEGVLSITFQARCSAAGGCALFQLSASDALCALLRSRKPCFESLPSHGAPRR